MMTATMSGSTCCTFTRPRRRRGPIARGARRQSFSSSPSLSLPPHRSKLGLQFAYLRVEAADGVRLERHLLPLVRRITPRFEIVDVAPDPFREGVDVLGRRDPALASGNGRLGRVDFEERLEHEPDDAPHERVDDRTRIRGQGPHNVMRPAEENLVDPLLRPSALCRALDSAGAHRFTDGVTHLPGNRLAGLAHR